MGIVRIENMDRRDFLKLTAAAPTVGLISMLSGSLRIKGNAETGEPLTECLAGSIDLTAPGLDVYGSHCAFYESIPFVSSWITLEVVPKFECFNQLLNGNTYHTKKNGKVIPVNALLQLCLGAAGSEVAYITDLHLRKENQYVIPFLIPSEARITLRIKDGMQSPTRYKVHMLVTGSSG